MRFLLALALLLGGAAQAALPLQAPLPDGAWPAMDGRTVQMASLKGKPVLVNLWATWCPPCIKELPVLVDLHRAHAADGLQVVGISLDMDLALVERAVEKHRLEYTVLHDPNGVSNKAFRADQLPMSYLFDAQGRLVWQHDDIIDPADPAFRAALKRVLPRGGPKGTDARLRPLKAFPSPIPPTPTR